MKVSLVTIIAFLKVIDNRNEHSSKIFLVAASSAYNSDKDFFVKWSLIF
jgi:hypothetical protein